MSAITSLMPIHCYLPTSSTRAVGRPDFWGRLQSSQFQLLERLLLVLDRFRLSESSTATQSLDHARALLAAGHCLGVYPEGTLTRDENGWPMRAKTGIARLAIATQVPVIPCAQWGAQGLLRPYGKVPTLWRRTRVTVIAGDALDFSRWRGRSEDQAAQEEATLYVMSAITELLERIRGEHAPKEVFDPKASDLPRIGNYKKAKNNKK